MGVYVDTAMIPHKGKLWCHLIGDTMAELHEFAGKLGLERQWCHNETHYDVTLFMRARAVQKGAKVVSRAEFVQVLRAQRTRDRVLSIEGSGGN